ncbi:ATP-grasp domain-containing protein [Burkholderia ubonensis]|uniref:ATP-grasp domain-containing protein n=1 Tax=Burkholderia ubonensis TaxID=101571 RepID=UPI000A83FA30|nr:hypothetical protein [Burkholderia ubonensis]
MILCVGLAADDTFVHTLGALRHKQVAFDAIDMAELALSGEVSLRFDDISNSILATRRKHYELGLYSGAWVRLFDISSQAPSEAISRRASGIFYALSRLFQLLPIRVVNPPGRDLANYSKLFHSAHLASKVGWKMPRSCLTNDSNVASAFIENCTYGAIFKGASAVKTWATQYDASLHAARLPYLANSPVLFQEMIAGPDVRVHVIGDFISAELIESDKLDYRTSSKNKFHRIDLSDDIADGCRFLTRSTSVPFLGIDFKVSESTGEWYFLEANSMPCYQGYDIRSGRVISRALVDWLVQT